MRLLQHVETFFGRCAAVVHGLAVRLRDEDVATLEAAVDRAQKLLPLTTGESGKAFDAELASLERAAVESMLAAEALSHEAYLERRGNVRGIREARRLLQDAMQRGAAAQIELERRQSKAAAKRI